MDNHDEIRARCAEETRRPGKFEGAPPWAPYFWDATLDGGGDDTWDAGETPVEVFHITPEDAAIFPDLKTGDAVLVWEDSSGFVHAVTMSAADAAAEERRQQAREDSEACAD